MINEGKKGLPKIRTIKEEESISCSIAVHDRNGKTKVICAKGKSLISICPYTFQITEECKFDYTIIGLSIFNEEKFTIIAFFENYDWAILAFPTVTIKGSLAIDGTKRFRRNILSSDSQNHCSNFIPKNKIINDNICYYESSPIIAKNNRSVAALLQENIIHIFTTKKSREITIHHIPMLSNGIIDMCFVNQDTENIARIAVIGDISTDSESLYQKKRSIQVYSIDMSTDNATLDYKIDIPKETCKLVPVDLTEKFYIYALSYNGITKIDISNNSSITSEFYTCNVDFLTLLYSYWNNDNFFLYGASGIIQAANLPHNGVPTVEKVASTDLISSMVVVDQNCILTTTVRGDIITYDIIFDNKSMKIKQNNKASFIGKIESMKVLNDSSFRIFTGYGRKSCIHKTFLLESYAYMKSLNIGQCIDLFLVKNADDYLICLSYMKSSKFIKFIDGSFREEKGSCFSVNESTILFKKLNPEKYLQVTQHNASLICNDSLLSKIAYDDEISCCSSSNDYLVIATPTKIDIIETEKFRIKFSIPAQEDQTTILIDNTDEIVARYCLNRTVLIHSIHDETDTKCIQFDMSKEIPSSMVIVNNDIVSFGTNKGSIIELSVGKERFDILSRMDSERAAFIKKINSTVFCYNENELGIIKERNIIPQIYVDMDSFDAIDNLYVFKQDRIASFYKKEGTKKLSNSIEYAIPNVHRTLFYKDKMFTLEDDKERRKIIVAYDKGSKTSSFETEPQRITIMQLIHSNSSHFIFIGYENNIIQLLDCNLMLLAFSHTKESFASAVCTYKNNIIIAEGEALGLYDLNLERHQHFPMSDIVFITSLCTFKDFIVIGDALKSISIVSIQNERLKEITGIDLSEREISLLTPFNDLLVASTFDEKLYFYDFSAEGEKQFSELFNCQMNSRVICADMYNGELYIGTLNGGIYKIFY